MFKLYISQQILHLVPFFCHLLLLLTFYVVYFDIILNEVVLNKNHVLLIVCNDFAFMLPAVCKGQGIFFTLHGFDLVELVGYHGVPFFSRYYEIYVVHLVLTSHAP